MLTRALTYIRLGLLDLVRLWPATQQHVVIVAGICLPVLLLLGLKRGQVTELRQALLTSPSGRKMKFGSPDGRVFLTFKDIQQFEEQIPGIEVIIPDIERQATFQAATGDKRSVPKVAVRATREIDPELTHLGATLPQHDERSVILSKPLARDLGVSVGDRVTAILSREKPSGQESPATVDLKVISIIELESHESEIAYVHLSILNRFLTYAQNFAIPDFHWPAGGSSVKPTYTSWLVFCEKRDDYSRKEIQELEIKYRIVDRTADLPKSLHRLLDPARIDELRVYQFFDRNPNVKLDDPTRLDVFNPAKTRPDEVLIPWDEPLTSTLEGKPWQLVGLSADVDARWLRDYFRKGLAIEDVSVDGFGARLAIGNASGKTTINWPTKRGASMVLKLEGEKPIEDSAETLALVAPNLLAWLTGEQQGDLEYDPTSRLFKLPTPKIYYTVARLYGRTIDDIPAIEDSLKERDCKVKTDHSRIREIHKQDSSLQLLVWVVGTGVFLFGVLTVISVLHDSTDRKRGTIGILRVMGTSRTGIFLLIFIRATVIGFLAWMLTAVLGWLIAMGLSWPSEVWTWKPVVAVDLHPFDFLLILAGALLCCAVGAIWPAHRASRLDPFDAIIEGRFR